MRKGLHYRNFVKKQKINKRPIGAQALTTWILSLDVASIWLHIVLSSKKHLHITILPTTYFIVGMVFPPNVMMVVPTRYQNDSFTRAQAIAPEMEGVVS